jgi:ABC-type multidrug transport system fused ATPase/permease subunit
MAQLLSQGAPQLIDNAFLDGVVNFPGEISGQLWFALSLVVVSALIKLVQNGIVAYLSYYLNVKIARGELWRFSNSHYQNIAHYSRSYMINNIINRTHILTNSALYAAISVFLSATSIVCVLVVLTWSASINLPYFEILVTALASATLMVAIYRLLGSVSEKISKGTEMAVAALLAIVENIQVLKVYRLQKSLSAPFLERYSTLRRAQAFILVLGASPRIVLELLLYSSIILSISRAPTSGLEQPQGLDSVLIIALLRLLPYFANLFGSFMTLAGAQRDIIDFLNFSKGLREASARSFGNVNELPRNESAVAAIRFSNVGYIYHDGTRALRNVSLTVKHNEILGIRGPSGVGKSTVVNLMCGLLDASEGSVSHAASLILRDKLHDRNAIDVALVQQSVLLIPNTLRWNITLEDKICEDVDARAHQLLIKLGFNEELASGLSLDTHVGDGYRQLSGGQVQRLGLARALYARKRLIVLDEFTSALDANAEAACLAAIDNIRGSATVVIVSHRESPYKICDRVVTLS